MSIGNSNTAANKEVEVEFSVVNLGENIVTVSLEQYNPSTSSNESVSEQAYTLEPGRIEHFTVIGTAINNEPLTAVLTSEGEGANAFAVSQISYTYLDELVESKLVKICNTGEFDDDYRFGFNGKVKDNEVMGEGNWQDYGARMYNTRLGRFPNVDPKTHLSVASSLQMFIKQQLSCAVFVRTECPKPPRQHRHRERLIIVVL